MNQPDTEKQQDAETLEHLLGVVIENREKRCLEVRDRARQQVHGVIHQAYARGRARLHRHVMALREKYRIRMTSVVARNLTLLRRQHQQENRALLDVAWPELRKSMQAAWDAPASRQRWIDAAIGCANSRLLGERLHVEYPDDLDADGVKKIKHSFEAVDIKVKKLVARADVKAGIRIISRNTVIDSTIEGLLRQRDRIEAELLARLNDSGMTHE